MSAECKSAGAFMLALALLFAGAAAAAPKDDGGDALVRFFECRLLDRAGANECLRGEARALHERGLGVEGESPDEAIRLFEEATRADPSYAPAYISLCRALLDRDGETPATIARMRALLAHAPKVPEIGRLQMRIGRPR